MASAAARMELPPNSGGKQMSTGHLHSDRFGSVIHTKIEHPEGAVQ